MTGRTWHPIFAADERSPGVFTLVGTFGDEYGIVEIRRSGDRVIWKALYRGEVLGYSTTLRLAVERVHAAYLVAHGPGGSPAARWGDRR